MDFFEQNVEYLAKSSNKDAIHDQIRKFYETSCDVQAKLLYATNYAFDHLNKIKNEESLKPFIITVYLVMSLLLLNLNIAIVIMNGKHSD